MQTLTKTHIVVIEDYDLVTTLDEKVDWMKLTHLLSKNSLELRASFCALTFTLKKLIASLNVHTKEK